MRAPLVIANPLLDTRPSSRDTAIFARDMCFCRALLFGQGSKSIDVGGVTESEMLVRIARLARREAPSDMVIIR